MGIPNGKHMFLWSDFNVLGSTRDFRNKLLINYSAVECDYVYKQTKYTYYYEKMNPVYDFIGTTNSTKINKKIKDKDIQKNRVFVIRKTLHDGTVTYGEYHKSYPFTM